MAMRDLICDQERAVQGRLVRVVELAGGTEATGLRDQRRSAVLLELRPPWAPRSRLAERLCDPDARVGAARDRVARLEQAIAAMDSCQGPEVDVLVASLKKAQKESQELPLDAQIRARDAFIRDGGEPEEIGGTPCSARCPASATNNRCERRSESSPADELQGPTAPLVVSPFHSRKRRISISSQSRRFQMADRTKGHEYSTHVWEPFRSRSHFRSDHRCGRGGVAPDEEDVSLSVLVTPVTQPASFVPTWAESPETHVAPGSGVPQPLCTPQSMRGFLT